MSRLSEKSWEEKVFSQNALCRGGKKSPNMRKRAVAQGGRPQMSGGSILKQGKGKNTGIKLHNKKVLNDGEAIRRLFAAKGERGAGRLPRDTIIGGRTDGKGSIGLWGRRENTNDQETVKRRVWGSGERAEGFIHHLPFGRESVERLKERGITW